MIDHRKTRIAKAFTSQAEAYDDCAAVQRLVADRLAARIMNRTTARPRRILEIGCGTGLLSAHLADAFPTSDLLLTDITPAMLDRCRSRIGTQHRYQVLDGEQPAGVNGPFDLIASSLALQWFGDLRGGLERLCRLLAPNGRMIFATLGCHTFLEWRRAHADLGLACGTHVYPSAEAFPWPAGYSHAVNEELIAQPHANGADFVRSLKALGAREPTPGYRPLPPGAFRRLLTSLEGRFSVTYHVLYAEIFR